jgi:hypothetical protein
MEEKNQNIFAETWSFLKARKAWWLTPIILVTFLLGALMTTLHSSAVSPFIYILF